MKRVFCDMCGKDVVDRVIVTEVGTKGVDACFKGAGFFEDRIDMATGRERRKSFDLCNICSKNIMDIIESGVKK